METTELLQKLGLSEYEAKAYLALLSNPGANGYEVAKASGVPRAKIYEVLAGLAARDVVATSQEEERTFYHPVDPDDLLRRYMEEAERTANTLLPALRELRTREPEAALVTVRAYTNIMARAREVLRSARHRAFVTGWPKELEALGGELEAAEGRGVSVYVVTYAPVSLPISRVYEHNPIGDADFERAADISWLVVVADHDEVLIAEASTGIDAVALQTRNRTVATMAAEYTKHQVFGIELDRLLDERGINLNRELRYLQAMWYERWDEGERE